MPPDVGGFVVPRSLKGARVSRPGTTEAYGRPYAPEFGAYPRPRVDRIGASANPGAAVAGPRPLMVPFNIQSGAGLRTSAAVAQLVGPSILRGVYLISTSGGPAASLDLSLDIGYATSAVSEQGVALSTPRPYTSIFTPQFLPSSQIQANIFGIPSSVLINSQSLNTLRWDIPIQASNYFLILATCNNEAAAQNFLGVVVLLDGVDPGALANFL